MMISLDETKIYSISAKSSNVKKKYQTYEYDFIARAIIIQSLLCRHASAPHHAELDDFMSMLIFQ
jgi:hypothetical protein